MNSDHLLAFVRENNLVESLFLISFELCLLVAFATLASAFFRNRNPRLIATLWVVVLLKPLVSICFGSPFAVIEFSSNEFVALNSEPALFDDRVNSANAAIESESSGNNPFLQVEGEKGSNAPCVVEDTDKTNRTTHLPISIGDGEARNDHPTFGAAFSLFGRSVVICWLAGVAVVLAFQTVRYFRLRQTINSSEAPCEAVVARYVEIAAELEIKKVPDLRLTNSFISPAITGLFHPVILVPKWLVRQSESDSLAWALRHELNHLKVGDLISNFICSVTSSVFFFHPLVWWARRQWRFAMELACDRDLLMSESEAADYADALYRILSNVKHNRKPDLASSLFASRTQIGRRIELLLAKRVNWQSKPSMFAVACFLVCTFAIMLTGTNFADSSTMKVAINDPTSSTNIGTESDNEVSQGEISNSKFKSYKTEHVTVRFSDVRRIYAKSVAEVVEVAREVAAEKYGYEMPEKIHVTMGVDPSSTVRLFNDGDQRFSLTIRSEKDLLRPSQSGKYHIYGLCHEVAHLAMYRPIRNRRWMTTGAAEGWAHFLGSHLVDDVYERLGAELWPDPYDYRNDGIARLENQLRSHASQAENARPTTMGAGLWSELANQIGHDKIADIFQGWGEADLQPGQFKNEIERLLIAATHDDALIRQWWKRAQKVFVASYSRSNFATKAIAAEEIGDVKELSHDDGQSAGKKSIAGSGHAVQFRVENDSSVLTSVRIRGSRYGAAQAPRENFSVWLCDQDFNEIKEFQFPYSKFKRGSEKWVKLEIDPTTVPREFFVCVGFNPTGSKGVFVFRDKATSGQSFTGLPGRGKNPFADGDWMIRASVGTVSRMRSWSDTSGKFSVEAEFVALDGGNVKLKKPDGTTLSVLLARLSKKDRDYVESIQKAVKSKTVDGKTIVLKQDDGQPAGRKSFPQGFAAAFSAKDDSSMLTGVKIHGSRYGSRRAPNENFEVALCDSEFNLISTFEFPYSSFSHGNAKWVSLPIKEAKVPKDFVICLNFNATQSKGVYISHDAKGQGMMGQPGRKVGSFNGGDWLIRAEISQSD